MPTTLADLLSTVIPGQVTALTLAKSEKDGVKVSVEQRNLQPEPPLKPLRAETQARAHVFLTPESLGDYLAAHGTPKTAIYADPVRKRIDAVVDETAKDGTEILAMMPETHPTAKPWKDLIDRKDIDLDDFVDMLLLNRRAIVAPEPREMILTLSQLKATKKVEIFRGRGAKSLNGVMVEFNVQGTKGQTELIDIPESIRICVPVYHGSKPQDIDIDLSVDASGEGDRLHLVIHIASPGWRDAELAAFGSMLKTVQEKGGKHATLGLIGSPLYKDWAYLGQPSPATQQRNR